MSETITLTLYIASGIALIPVAVFCAECALSLVPRSKRRETADRPVAVVLIPAHNEAAGIERTLRTLLPTLRPDDRALVVADNCTDDTASIARTCGAIVVERKNLELRGKGFALEFGMRAISDHLMPAEALTESEPDSANTSSTVGGRRTSPVIVFLDADCQVTPDTVDQLARAVARTGGPVQGLNLSEAEPSGVQAVSSLGFHFKNLVRPSGLARIGMPCQLMGTGMALPWEIASQAVFAGTNLVEDMQLGVDLAISGKPTHFCATALVTSRLPTGAHAFLSQRTRWEHGHLRTSLTQIPRLTKSFVCRLDLRLLALALDLTVPPFSMLLFGVAGLWCFSVVAALCGSSWGPAVLLSSAFGTIALVVLGGWARYCRQAVPFSALAMIPVYMARKLPIYFSFLTRRGQREWVRTDREFVARKGT